MVRQQQTLSTKLVIGVVKSVERSYGHFLVYPGGSSWLAEEEVGKTTVAWGEDAVTVTSYLGTQIRIPKGNFTGGR